MKRIHLISVGFIVFALAVLIRILYLQVFCYEEMVKKANDQELYTVHLSEPIRGDILDRNKVSVTANQGVSALLVVPMQIEDPNQFVKKMCEVSDFSEENLLNKIIGEKENGEVIRKQPFIAMSDLSEKEIAAFEDIGESGLYMIPRTERYVRDLPAQHLIGALEQKNDISVGISGLEYFYDDILFGGKDRQINYLIDNKNRFIVSSESDTSIKEKSLCGHLELTLDLNVQRVAEAALKGLSGAVVVLDSKTSDVLALASSPKYDPYFVKELKSNDAFVNKSLKSYPPASLFKIFIAAVALENEVVAKESAFYCDGIFKTEKGSVISCWNKNGHGLLTFEDSLAFSCNPVYVNLSVNLGKESLEKAFSQWELNKDILLGYPLNELSSLHIEGESELSLGNAGLGENGVLLTPVNVAKMINVIASGGNVVSPRIVSASFDAKGKVFEKYDISDPKRVISQETAAIVTDMMVKTFQTGTGKNLNLDEFQIAGKTGSSETGNVWIGGFFPYDDPQYTVVVLVTGAESGTTDAGPVMKKICGYLGNYDVND